MSFLQSHTLRITIAAILCAVVGPACARKDETPQRVDSLGQILTSIPDSAMRQRWREAAAKGQLAPLESLPVPSQPLATRTRATIRDTGNVAKTPTIPAQTVADIRVAAVDAPETYSGAFTVVSAEPGRISGRIAGRSSPLPIIYRVPGDSSAVAAVTAGTELRLRLRDEVVNNSQRAEVSLSDAARAPVLFKLSDGGNQPYARRFEDMPLSVSQQPPGRDGVAPVTISLADSRAVLRPGDRATLTAGTARVQFILLSSYWTAPQAIETAEGDPFHVIIVGHRVR